MVALKSAAVFLLPLLAWATAGPIRRFRSGPRRELP